MAYNFTHRKQSVDGFLCNRIGRRFLVTCAYIEEEIKLLKNIPNRHSFSYILLDQSGESIVVEASTRNVIARKSNVCTNHFHILDEENRYRQDDSRRREIAMQKEQQFATNPYEAFQILNQPKHHIFS